VRIGKDEKVYARTEADRDRIIKESKRKEVHVTRFKGLGEMNPEDLSETTMNPKNRTLARVTVDQAAEADNVFTVLLGEKVEPRRAFIERHAREAKNIDTF
jgi:DNA gyrase subunit B